MAAHQASRQPQATNLEVRSRGDPILRGLVERLLDPPAPNGLLDVVGGHLRTLVPSIRHGMFPSRMRGCQPFSTTICDPQIGEIVLRGVLDDVPDADAAVLVVHGLGGSADSHYCTSAAIAARMAGVSCLRLWLRGADHQGDDIYHAALTIDLHAALASPALARYRRLFVLGFSLGGHVALRLALAPSDARLRAVAAICAPLDLATSCAAIDAPARWIYRQHVLRGLRRIYAAVAARRLVPTPKCMIDRVSTIREWDRLTVVPRHGFASVDDYYERASVGPRLGQLAVPVLLVASAADPMVPLETVYPALRKRSRLLDARVVSGGHVSFASNLDLAEHGPVGLDHQLMTWLMRHR